MITDSYNLKALLPPAATIIWLLHIITFNNVAQWAHRCRRAELPGEAADDNFVSA